MLPFQFITRRKRKIQAPIIVTSSTNAIKASDKQCYLHVYRCHPSTTEIDIINFLKPKFHIIQCKKLQPRRPNVYASFKLTVSLQDLQDIKNPENGVFIRRFFIKAALEQPAP